MADVLEVTLVILMAGKVFISVTATFSLFSATNSSVSSSMIPVGTIFCFGEDKRKHGFSIQCFYIYLTFQQFSRLKKLNLKSLVNILLNFRSCKLSHTQDDTALALSWSYLCLGESAVKTRMDTFSLSAAAPLKNPKP